MNTNTQIAVKGAVQIEPAQIVIRPTEQILSDFIIGEDNSVQFKPGVNVKLDEVIAVCAERANGASSMGIQAANMLRLTRSFPAVKVASGGGDKPLVAKDVPAFQVACERLASLCATPSTYQNVKGLVECIDVKEANNLPASPFAIKEALGYLRKAEVLNEKGKLSAGDKVVKALKAGTGVNALRPIIDKAKEAKPDLFKKSGGTSTPPAATEWTADKLARSIDSLIGEYEKTVAYKGNTVESVRKAVAEKVKTLAKLAGVI